jgi:hypothetical protein
MISVLQMHRFAGSEKTRSQAGIASGHDFTRSQ